MNRVNANSNVNDVVLVVVTSASKLSGWAGLQEGDGIERDDRLLCFVAVGPLSDAF